MEWVALLLTIGLLPLCIASAAFVFGVYCLVYWLQTIVRLMQVERAENKTAWLLLVIALNVVGALIYNTVRGNVIPARGRVPPSVAASSLRVMGVLLLGLGGVGVVVVLGVLLLASVSVPPPLPTMAATPLLNMPATEAAAFATWEAGQGAATAHPTLPDPMQPFTAIAQTAQSQSLTATASTPTPNYTATPYVINSCLCTATPAP